MAGGSLFGTTRLRVVPVLESPVCIRSRFWGNRFKRVVPKREPPVFIKLFEKVHTKSCLKFERVLPNVEASVLRSPKIEAPVREADLKIEPPDFEDMRQHAPIAVHWGVAQNGRFLFFKNGWFPFWNHPFAQGHDFGETVSNGWFQKGNHPFL